jgi:L,D-peptidoglycan transpeptidase YkuD (ErfK/YbiS/YcfS/YnhG family)
VVALGFLTVQGVRSVVRSDASDDQGVVSAASSPEAPVSTPDVSTSSETVSARSSGRVGLPLGPETLSTVPATADQVVIVRGKGPTSSIATVELYERSGDWTRVASWKGHVGRSGWSTKPREGDLRTPVGTFTLSDAGGRKPDPGTKLPYHRSDAFVAPEGEPGFGDSMASAFNYVVAVDFNRVAGRSPLDQARPQGWKRGGGIWIHVDHNGPTHGCISIPQTAMRTLLRTLEPGEHPVVVMGDRARLRS